MKKIVFSLLASVVFFGSLHAQQQSSAASVDKPFKKNVAKFAVFSPLGGHLSFGYERYIRNGISLDTKFGIMKVGVNYPDNITGGFYFRGGPKILFSPDWVLKGQRRSHHFHGAYLKPELAFSLSRYEGEVYVYQYPTSTLYPFKGTGITGALLVSLGKQWVLSDIVTLDLSFSVGYGFRHNNTNWSSGMPLNYYYSDDYLYGYSLSKYGFMVGPKEFPIAGASNFSLGFIF